MQEIEDLMCVYWRNGWSRHEKLEGWKKQKDVDIWSRINNNNNNKKDELDYEIYVGKMTKRRHLLSNINGPSLIIIL